MIHHIKRVVSEFLSNLAFPKYGIISAYNPANYTVKVQLQPEGIETAFIPLEAIWVGNNLGAVFGPNIGDQVRLSFIDGNQQACVVGGRFFRNAAQPPLVQSGQAAFVDSQGSYIKLNNDGTITLGAPTGITSTTPLLTQQGNLQINGNVTINGNQQSNGNITASGTVTGQTDVIGNGKSLHNHTHTVGAAVSTPPN